LEEKRKKEESRKAVQSTLSYNEKDERPNTVMTSKSYVNPESNGKSVAQKAPEGVLKVPMPTYVPPKSVSF
jgi:hypothetical protein